jgi:hypothetical protein
MRPTVPFGLALLTLSGALVLAGCTHAHTFDLAHEGDRLIVNNRVERERVTVRLASGERARAEVLRIGADSTSWVDPSTRAVRRVATAEVVALESGRRRGRGAGDGAQVGALIGALTLGLTAYTAFQSEGGEDSGAVLFASFLAVSGAGSGALYGAGIGALVGSRDVYRFVTVPTPEAEGGG